MRAPGTGEWDGTFQSWRPRKAREEWRCDGGCGMPITPGEVYLEIKIRDAGWDTVRLCFGCEAEHERQATEERDAVPYEVYTFAEEDGRVFKVDPKRWERP